MRRIRPSPSGAPIDLFERADAAEGLRTTLYVDQQTLVPLASQDGSIETARPWWMTFP